MIIMLGRMVGRFHRFMVGRLRFMVGRLRFMVGRLRFMVGWLGLHIVCNRMCEMVSVVHHMCHVGVLLPVVGRHPDVKHLLETEGVAGMVGRRGHIVSSWVLVVRLVHGDWLIGWLGSMICWFWCMVGWLWVVGWLWAICWFRMIHRLWVICRFWGMVGWLWMICGFWGMVGWLRMVDWLRMIGWLRMVGWLRSMVGWLRSVMFSVMKHEYVFQ
jgi:hypothetical protein